ncbi:hypothetical protein [Lewinella sp. IMCC34191]|uniref:hypothetical protein n=1 Tax=Lewinella sp. IMCC34191 TaxID=2259172 RepID=UPI000E27F761|nr:hypothetical protein [Lewinella sp. IMCC34191]
MKYLFLFLLPLSFLTTSCLEDENAFTVEASPVKADILMVSDPADETVVYQGTFTELDKAGILDHNVGIVASPVSNLEISVTDQEQNLLESIVTDTDGRATFSVPAASLTGVTRLEWAGTYNGQAFRILKNL